MTGLEFFDIIPFGDNALLINITHPDLSQVNKFVVKIVQLLKCYRPKNTLDIIPASNSVTIVYDNLRTDYARLTENLQSIFEKDPEDYLSLPNRVELPVCYHDEYAPDLEEVCVQTGLTPANLISIHVETTYTVLMTGFMPGFFYLGVLPEKINVSRKRTPRTMVPSGAVGLAERQTGIYSVNSPGGWQIIGRSLNLLKEITEGSIKSTIGDEVRFYEVSKLEFNNLSRR
ncbi:MAG: 5-oxoprolinase subunit PxpB [Cyclobacteriaceae bacterium]